MASFTARGSSLVATTAPTLMGEIEAGRGQITGLRPPYWQAQSWDWAQASGSISPHSQRPLDIASRM